MTKLIAFAAALAFVSAPVLAQTRTMPTQDAPGTQNSGAGIAGQPGNKNGPAPQKGTTGSMTNDSSNGQTMNGKDASKVPGKPGGKSGPAVKEPSK